LAFIGVVRGSRLIPTLTPKGRGEKKAEIHRANSTETKFNTTPWFSADGAEFGVWSVELGFLKGPANNERPIGALGDWSHSAQSLPHSDPSPTRGDER
jgi:hypothetical protein